MTIFSQIFCSKNKKIYLILRIFKVFFFLKYSKVKTVLYGISEMHRCLTEFYLYKNVTF